MLYQVKSGNPDPPIIGPDVPLFKIFRVRIPPGYKVFRFLGKHSSAVVCKMTYIISIVCVLKGEIKALATKLFFFLKKKTPLLQIFCGENCTFVIHSNGAVSACGEGSNGRLGLGNSDDCDTLTLISALRGDQAGRQGCQSTILNFAPRSNV
jgi:hypothetical protein